MCLFDLQWRGLQPLQNGTIEMTTKITIKIEADWICSCLVTGGKTPDFKASLGTTIYQGISIFPWKNKLISLGKIEIPWKIEVAKLALFFFFSSSYYFYFLITIAPSSLSSWWLLWIRCSRAGHNHGKEEKKDWGWLECRTVKPPLAYI
jgi:hypothetical protein